MASQNSISLKETRNGDDAVIVVPRRHSPRSPQEDFATNSNMVLLLPPPVAVSLPEVVMKPVGVEHSKLSLLHSRLTAIANWSHPLERLANDGTSSRPVRSRDGWHWRHHQLT